MGQKWNVQNKKGYLNIHVAVNIKTKEILVLEVTDEKIHDGKMLRKPVNHVLDSSSSRKPNTIKKFFVSRWTILFESKFPIPRG